MSNNTDSFSTTFPIVSFTGPIVGPGSTLLTGEAVPGLGDIQLKCCGFVQLSSYLAPGDPTKTPFKGFHPFQVFVIFPIHTKPWNTLCKKMADRKETHFQSNVLLSCTGKVAGFLDHRIMVHPPQLAQDFVFIVVPDTWQFLDKAGQDSISTPLAPSVTTPAKKPPTDPFDPARFMSPSKPITRQTTTPTMTTRSTVTLSDQASHTEPTNLTLSTTALMPAARSTSGATKRPNQFDELSSPSTPSKKTRPVQPAQEVKQDSSRSSTITLDEPFPPSSPIPNDTTDSLTSSISSAPPLSLEDTTRPHRNRHPPKKFAEIGDNITLS
jgi:hypothetical protein